MHVYRVAERGLGGGLPRRWDWKTESVSASHREASGRHGSYLLSLCLARSIYLTRSPALYFRPSPFYSFSLWSESLSSFFHPSRNLCSAPRACFPDVFFCHVFCLSCFLCIRLSPSCVVFLMFHAVSLLSQLTVFLPSKTKCVSNWE